MLYYINRAVSCLPPVFGTVTAPLCRCHKDKFLHIHPTGCVMSVHMHLSCSRFLPPPSPLFLPGSSHLIGLRDSGERHHETPAEEPRDGQAGQRASHQHCLRTDRFVLLCLLTSAPPALTPGSLWLASCGEVTAVINNTGRKTLNIDIYQSSPAACVNV